MFCFSCTKDKKNSTIQYGYRKWGTHAQVFSLTLAHGNSNMEIRQRDRRRREVSMERSKAARKEEVPKAFHYQTKKQH